ncbi:tubulin-tyrosine ligase family-domain-containing protein [Schizophyllum commune]
MSASDSTTLAFVSWPTAPLTESLVLRAIQRLSPSPKVVSSLPQINPDNKLLQWSTYDDMDHELTHIRRSSVLASSYIIRKALIRKHFLSRTIHAYLTKHPDSILKEASPRTYEIEISYADELDEIFADELYDLEQDLEQGRWWILKPGMADRGNGIRLFNSREALTKIFEDFEDDSEDEDEEKDVGTGVVTSQLRHFVVQVLFSHQFHLRAYCVASGALTLYLFDRILALFSSVPYTPPQPSSDDVNIDLAPHLTNTSLQTHRGEEGVRLLDELATFTKAHIADIVSQMTQILSETFKAAMANPVHFQPIPNAFELFGVDFLVQHNPAAETAPGTQPFLVKLLEINAEPAIELTGPRLAWILEDLFVAIGKQCVQPFLDGRREGGDGEPKDAQKEGNAEGEKTEDEDETSHLIACLQEIRGA